MTTGGPAERGAAGAPPTFPPAPPLDGRQATLFEALASRSDRLGQIYLGVLSALERGDSESLAQSAHSMRELLEKLPTFFDEVPQERVGPTLKQAANTLLDHVERAKRSSRCWSDGKWEGEIDAPLRKLLDKGLETFSAVVAAAKPPRRAERTALLRRVDASPYPMPQAVEDLRIKEWEAHADFFQRLSHHDITVEIEDFRGRLWRCEQFLLDCLVPRTFDSRAEIAAIIAEVEGGH